MIADPPPDLERHDVRMDGVFFFRSSAAGPFAKALDAGNYSYCVMVRSGRLRLETDFPAPVEIELGPGDAVAVSGLAPHLFRTPGAAPEGGVGRFERSSLARGGPAAEIDLVVGVAPVEALALGSLVIGPILVRPAEHPDLSRRLWNAVEMLVDEYDDASWIDRNLVIRRLAEIMLINMSRRILADHLSGDGGQPRSASPPVMRAISAVLRSPERVWTLAALARVTGMSRTQFSEAFKATTGHSPGRITSRLRLTAVARRLADEPLSVEAAAESAGYSSAAAFVRAFQRQFGETPARWRRRRRSEAERPRSPARPPSSKIPRFDTN